jgi:hypothetical protein
MVFDIGTSHKGARCPLSYGTSNDVFFLENFHYFAKVKLKIPCLFFMSTYHDILSFCTTIPPLINDAMIK